MSAQVPRTKTSSLSVRSMFLSTVSLFSHDPPDRREANAARAKDRFQRLAGMVSTHFLLLPEMVTLQKGKYKPFANDSS